MAIRIEELQPGVSADMLGACDIDALENPLENRGDFCLPQYDTELSGYKHESGRQYEGRGTIYKDSAQMSDGTTYRLYVGQPDEPLTDVPVLFTTAWLTTTGGHNRDVLSRLMDIGYPAVLVGREGGYLARQRPLMERWRQLIGLEVGRSAHNLLKIAEVTSVEYDHRPDEAVVIGESRGAMVAMGVMALADTFGVKIDYADVTSPCFARQLKLQESSNIVEQAIPELMSLAKLLGHWSLRRIGYLPGTLDLSPASILPAIATARALISGQAGMLARHIPTTQEMHVGVFEGDTAGQADEWESIFADHKMVEVQRLNGSHLSFFEDSVLDDTLKRLKERLVA